MDFLPRNFIAGAVFGSLCLISLPAFAVLDTPNYSWRLGQSGNVYKVYDPQGPHLSGNVNPGSSFAENSAGNGVIESVSPGPLTIDGATGEILDGVGLSRGLSLGDLIDGAKALMVPDNPYGAAFLALSLVGSLALDAFDSASASVSAAPGYEYLENGGSARFCSMSAALSYFQSVYPSSSCSLSGNSVSCDSGTDVYVFTLSSYPASTCTGTATPSNTPSSSETPSQAIQWAQANPSSFATNVAPTLSASPADQISLANDLANGNAPLSTPVPYSYNLPSNPTTVTGSPSTTSSTNPSTGQTTTTTSTPSYKFSTPTPPQEVQVLKTTNIVTQTCTSAGSCTTTNNTTDTAATPPQLGSFIPPPLSAATTSSVAPTPFALNLAMPTQSFSVCPDPLSYTAFGTAFTIPLTPLCTLATDVRPYVESLGAVGAGIVIFR
ncbi:virulence factor TspB C-terminal domain-related protein [Acidithiobacillus albertensis]|uniref:virulence factor TspB C-terminal domain-related protein n=1 Tax=Acidithiobacillus albertensis TaxID=119978 RepID=UPI000A4606C1|nr:virulence factor TspB C-terminal domain-related protein [Acidithiobacillus albertensis]